MSVTTRHHRIALPRPRTFAGLMALYESSFQRFVRLVPELDFPFQEAVSTSGSDNRLHLRVLERCKYTTTVHLTYWFGRADTAWPDPDLRVRLYRDAELAEAVDCRLGSRYAAIAGLDLKGGDILDAQWPRNLLLNKWLDYCLRQGHGFVVAYRPRLARPTD